MRRLGLMALLLACLGGTPALSDTTIGGWAVSAKPDTNGACMATRSYKDADDDNRKNAVVFGLVKGKTGTQMVMVLGYEDWNYDKGEAIEADLIVDGKTIHKKWKWEGDGKSLTTTFDDADTLVPILGAGKTLVVRFGKDGDASFLIPNAGLALGAAQLCLGSAGDAPDESKSAVAACEAPTGKETLSLANALLVADDNSKVDDIHKRASDTLKVGDPIILFVQPTGFACTKENTSYHAKFSVDLKLMYGDQVAVDQKGVVKRDFTADEPIKYVTINLTDRINGLVPGDFVIKLKVDDLVSGKSTEASIPMTLVK